MESQEKIHSRERERVVESKENIENELTEEAKAAATRERAEYLVKEVKSNTKQIQNIMVHMQEVLVLLQDLRKKLELSESADPSSVIEDKMQVERLKEKIQKHKTELSRMKEDLISAVQSEKNTDQSKHTREEAESIVKKMLIDLDIYE